MSNPKRQLDPMTGRKSKKRIKRQMSKYRRRTGKKDLEAPTRKIYSGYS